MSGSGPRVRRQRSVRESLASIVLATEAVVVILAALVVFGLKQLPPGVALGGGAALLVLIVLAAGLARYRAGIALGWVVQAALLAAEETAQELGLPVKMRLVSYSFVGVEPEVMGAGPIPSTEKALAQAGLTIDDIGAFEINEAFAVQVLALLDRVRRERSLTLVVVTHSAEVAAAADREVRLRDGQVVGDAVSGSEEAAEGSPGA